MKINAQSLFIALIVSLGGFLFGFDAGIISGVMEYAGPEFNLNDAQSGWVVSSPSFVAMFAMLISGRLSDIVGRKRILLLVGFFYALSALIGYIVKEFKYHCSVKWLRNTSDALLASKDNNLLEIH